MWWKGILWALQYSRHQPTEEEWRQGVVRAGSPTARDMLKKDEPQEVRELSVGLTALRVRMESERTLPPDGHKCCFAVHSGSQLDAQFVTQLPRRAHIRVSAPDTWVLCLPRVIVGRRRFCFDGADAGEEAVAAADGIAVEKGAHAEAFRGRFESWQSGSHPRAHWYGARKRSLGVASGRAPASTEGDASDRRRSDAEPSGLAANPPPSRAQNLRHDVRMRREGEGRAQNCSTLYILDLVDLTAIGAGVQGQPEWTAPGEFRVKRLSQALNWPRPTSDLELFQFPEAIRDMSEGDLEIEVVVREKECRMPKTPMASSGKQ
ncbi:hypothetical protein C8R46DRAFT_1192609 [Mycena filopes]|nr:hypothetical protein C8R46DRAFT_1192609 [Mycena filopes]